MKRFISILLVLAMVLGMTTSAFAEENTEQVQNLERDGGHVTLHVNYTDSWQEQVNLLLADERNEMVTVLFDDLLEEPLEAAIEPKGVIGPVYTKYVKNVRNADDYIGKTVIAKSRGEAGSTCSINVTKSVSTTLNNSFSCPVNLITAAVGWSVTGSTSVTVANSKKVPTTHDGKKVKAGTLNATVIYKVKKFDIWEGVQGTSIEKKLGTGDTKKAYGANFYMTYEYK